MSATPIVNKRVSDNIQFPSGPALDLKAIVVKLMSLGAWSATMKSKIPSNLMFQVQALTSHAVFLKLGLEN